jgi:hypothetical protein
MVFYNNKAMLKYSHICNWDLSKETNMNNLFIFIKIFNDYINNWNVSNVTSMYCIFQRAKNI